MVDYDESRIFVSSKYPVDTMATFSCDEGFSLSGSSSSICQDSGNWSQETPICGNELNVFYLHKNYESIPHTNILNLKYKHGPKEDRTTLQYQLLRMFNCDIYQWLQMLFPIFSTPITWTFCCQ